MKSMYDLSLEFQMLLQIAEDSFDEETGEVLADSVHRFDALNIEAEEKVAGTGFVLNRLKADSEAIESEIKRLTARRDAIRNERERLSDRLREFMATVGLQKVKTPYISVSIGKPYESVVVGSPMLLPDECVKLVRQPKKDEIKKLIDSGKYVPGAWIQKGKPRLTIR